MFARVGAKVLIWRVPTACVGCSVDNLQNRARSPPRTEDPIARLKNEVIYIMRPVWNSFATEEAKRLWDNSKRLNDKIYDSWWKHGVFWNDREWFFNEYWKNIVVVTDLSYDQMWYADESDYEI